MYTSIWCNLRVLSVLHRPEVVDIGVKSYIEIHAICLKDYRIRSLLSIRHAHGDLCKHLGIDSSTDLDLCKHLGIDSSTDLDLCQHLGTDLSTDLDDRYSNLFLNAYINRHAHT